MTDLTNAAGRALETAVQLRAAAAETRQALETARDLVQRSREQTRAAAIQPVDAMASPTEDPGPSEPLVTCLLRAYELAEDDGEPRTRALLASVITHVGYRIAALVGPRAAKAVMH